MVKKWKLGLLAMSVALLSACSTVADKSPDELYRYSVQRQFKQDSQYNFSGKMWLDVQPESAEARETRLDNEFNKMVKNHSDHINSAERRQEARQYFEKKFKMKELANQHLSNSVSLQFAGAWDLPNGKAELQPEIRYETRNAIASIKVPMLIDVKSESLVMDLAAVSPFIDMSATQSDEKLEPIDNRYVRVTLPENLSKKLPLKDLMAAFPKATEAGLATYDKSLFTALPLDERAKKLGATHRIAVKSTTEQDEKMMQMIFASLAEQLAQKQQDGSAQSNVSAEDYRRFVDVLRAISDAKQKERLKVKSLESLEGAINAETAKNMANMANISVESEIYLDNQGRILSQVQSWTLPEETLFAGRKVRVMSEMDINYTKKPVFVIQPNESNTVDLKVLRPELHQKLASLLQSDTEQSEQSTPKSTPKPTKYLDWKNKK